MRSSDCDILIIPGLGNSGPDHWQSRWQAKLSTARRVEQAEWDNPRAADWAERIADAVAAARRPAILIAHSCGAAAVAHAARRFTPGKAAGAFLVAMPDVESDAVPGACRAFASLPSGPLPFPSVLAASRNDPFCGFQRAEAFALSWRSSLVDAGEAGHINTASGHGPWPEGLLRLAGFLRQL